MVQKKGIFSTESYCNIACGVTRTGHVFTQEICNEPVPAAIWEKVSLDLASGKLNPGDVRRYPFTVVVQESAVASEAALDYWRSRLGDAKASLGSEF
jgi:hypothetical protein